MNKNEPGQNSMNPQSKEDDIDIGQLFTLIGRGFSNVFNFIGTIFKTLFYWIVVFILFLRDNFAKIILFDQAEIIINILIQLQGRSKIGFNSH